METQVRNNADLKAIEEQIELHKLSIRNLKKQKNDLLFTKLEKLLKETPEQRLYGFGKSYFYFEREKLVFVDLYGNHLQIGDHMIDLLENHCPYTLYKEICNVKMD